ncbi:hypothetical protein TFLX_01223 [Thermoflexales bacterium]|nr:hypothetical protein TFLX_01223 [Thermoflexales bacterium]
MKSKLRRDLLVLLFFTVLTLLMTWPLVAKLNTAYAGNNEDLWTFQWDNWWTRYALQRDYDTLFTPVQFYPVGVSLAAHSLSFYNSLLWIPLAALVGDIAAYNMTVLLTFILSGYTMFKLAEYLLQDARSRKRDASGEERTVLPATHNPQPITFSALIAGIIFAFAPYHFSQSLGHVSLASVQWFPLLALFILKATRETKRRNILWIGLTTLLIVATRLQFLVLGGVVLALFVLVDWLALRREWTRGAWPRLIVGVAIGLVLSLPIVLPAAQLYTQAESPDKLIADEQTWGQTDLAAYFVPMTYHPVFGSIVRPLYESFIKNRAWMPYLGFVPLLLAVWGAWRAKRRALPWVAVGLFCFVMALGPFLRVNGAELTDLPLPYALIGARFPMNILRSPDRYNLLLSLALAPLAAWGVQDVLARISAHPGRQSGTLNVDSRPPRAATLVGMVISAIILFEYLGIPYPTIDPLPITPFQQQLARDGENYAVLDIPLDRSATKRYLYYQTQHEKPTVQGRVARVPPEAYALFDQIPLLRAWRTDILAKRPPDLGSQLQALADRDVRYIILHKNLIPPETVISLRDYFTLPPAYEDDQIAVYSTALARTLAAQPVQSITDVIGIVNSWVGVEGPEKPIRVQVRWTITRPIRRELAYRLELIAENGIAVISQTDRLTPATSSWLSGTIVIGDYQLTPQSPLPLGRYRLQLSVLDGDRVIGSSDLPLRLVNVPVRQAGQWLMVVSAEPRTRFGDSIELRAADVSRRGNWLMLWLHWHALQAPGMDAKYFVHLLDKDGKIAVQDDGIHVKYTRPSSRWQANEMISDLIELPLWNLPPGDYRLAVGLTNPNTGERLPAFDEPGQPLPDRRYIFSEKITID